MGMVVRTNVMAMNANRSLSTNNSQVAKSLEKLSSGFRINRAADDASGLAISEKMKAQIKGLEQASANSQDGISLIQTAEGATQEVHNMLNRMVELATKSANGTIQNSVDREAIQKEVDDLNSEITRISKSTNFNGINLLDGSLDASAKVTTAAVAADATTGDTTTLDYTGKTGAQVQGSTLTVGSKTYEFVKTGGTVTDANNVAIEVGDTDNAATIATNVDTALAGDIAKMVGTAATGKYTHTATGNTVVITAYKKDAATPSEAAATVTQAGGGLKLQVGDTNASYNHVSVSVADLSATGLGTNGLKVNTQTDAGEAVNTIKTAINTVSTNRANLGSLQNRLEYTINNLDTTTENMTSANSRIRDTDMAKEMMNYTKMNILTQAAQAMLAQANQQPQAILQLLQ